MFVNSQSSDPADITRRIKIYRETASNAGVTFPILSDPNIEASIKAGYKRLRLVKPDGSVEDLTNNQVTEIEEGGDDHITLRLTGPIDPFFGFSPSEVIDRLDRANPKSIHLKLSSPGGYLDAANTLYADLRQRVRDGVTLTTEGIGLVASSAVMLLIAGEKRKAAEETVVGVHAPRVIAIGVFTKGKLKELESGLNFWVKQMSNYYIKRTGQAASQVAKWLDVEHDTRLTAQEAFDYGFLTVNPEGDKKPKTQNQTVPQVGLLDSAEQVIYNSDGKLVDNPYKEEA